ncbi:DUF3289 family protein [Pantoea vagans]
MLCCFKNIHTIFQKFESFGFKPFFTNMKAEFEIISRRNG